MCAKVASASTSLLTLEFAGVSPAPTFERGTEMVETGDVLVEGMYQKMWKDFVSLQRGDAKQICVDAARWRYFAQSAQTALILGSELDPHSKHDWLTECNKLADGLMALHNAELCGGEAVRTSAVLAGAVDTEE